MIKYYLESQNNPRNSVDYDDYLWFLAEWNRGEIKDQRFGQAFYLRFDKTGEVFPELYYETNFRTCEELIYKNYKLYHAFTES